MLTMKNALTGMKWTGQSVFVFEKSPTTAYSYSAIQVTICIRPML